MMVDGTEEHVKKISELEKRLKSLEEETEYEKEIAGKKIAELEENLKDLEEDVEGAQQLVITLATLQRQLNDEVENAKSSILQSEMLHKYATLEIGVKRVGLLNIEGWYEVCEDKFNNPEEFQEWVRTIDDKLRTHTFTPLKTMFDAKRGKMKVVVDEDDETLIMLRNKYGPVLASAVGAAALEIDTWNPSGRHIISMPWDFKADKPATMNQIFEHFVKVLKNKEKEVKDKEQEEDKQLKAFLVKEETESEKEIAEKKIAELEEKLNDLEEDVDCKDELVMTLTMKQREVNYEVEAAKTAILRSKMLLKYGTAEIGVKSWVS